MKGNCWANLLAKLGRVGSLIGMSRSDVEIEMKVVILNKNNKKNPWLATSTDTGGCKFVLLEKWSRDFTKFVTGKALDLRRCETTGINSTYFDHLLRQRNDKSKLAVKEATQVEEEGGNAQYVAKRRVTAKDRDPAPPFVEIELPEVCFGGAAFPARSVRVLWNVKSTDLWVELEADVLEHIRLGILQWPKTSRKRARDTSLEEDVNENTDP